MNTWGRPIRIPVHMVQAQFRYRRVMGQTVEESRELLPEEIVEEARLSPHGLETLRNFVKEPVSLDAPLGDGEKTMIDLLPDRNSQSPSDVAMRHELSDRMGKTLRMLSSREEMVIMQRFGIV